MARVGTVPGKAIHFGQWFGVTILRMAMANHRAGNT